MHYQDKTPMYNAKDAYKDIDGNMKQFTHIDHDVKTKIGIDPPLSDSEKKTLQESVKNSTELQIQAILALPAVSAVLSGQADYYEQFIIRDPEKGIIWRDHMVKDTCRLNDILRHNLFLNVWRNTVKEPYWFDDMSYEDIIEGKWKQLII